MLTSDHVIIFDIRLIFLSSSPLNLNIVQNGKYVRLSLKKKQNSN